ncbi:MAG: F0F1 ATP synthase subunit B [Chloroflexota bacterium]
MEILKTLGLNLTDFVWHLVNFLVLVFLLSKFLIKPISAMLDDRQRQIRESMEHAEKVRRDAEHAEEERAAAMATARREIQDMLSNATATAERIQSDARAEAQQQAQRIIERAQQEATAERAQSMADLRREVASLAVLAAERVINRSLDEPAHHQLVEEFLNESPSRGGA